jgi:hypothetical protein
MELKPGESMPVNQLTDLEPLIKEKDKLFNVCNTAIYNDTTIFVNDVKLSYSCPCDDEETKSNQKGKFYIIDKVNCGI